MIALDQKDLVYISEIRDDGLMVARYGKDSKRSDHLCCPRCTNETQIFPMIDFGEVMVCQECGLAVGKKKEKPSFFVFRSNGGKQHITLEAETPPVAITGRRFNIDGIEYDEELDCENLCSLCSRRYEQEYGSIENSLLASWAEKPG